MQRPASHVAMASGKILYSVTTVAFGFICFIVGAIAVGLPAWGYFQSYDSDLALSVQSYYFDNPNFDKGYFGPWRICKRLLYNREKCGSEVSKFRPLAAVYIAGVVGAIGVTVLGVFCVLSIVQLAMISSKDRVCLKYTSLVMLKMALALLATLLSVVAAAMFAAQTGDGGFYLERGEGFYVQIVCIVINALLFIMSIYDVLFARRPGGDPTDAIVADSPDRISRHPAFKDTRGISMTDASGKPYTTNGHGSTASMNTTNTTLTNLSDASTITRSPLRSSLKKPRPKEGDPSQGIHNPGYSGSSPNLNRNGSQKKVRINTHSTEV